MNHNTQKPAFLTPEIEDTFRKVGAAVNRLLEDERVEKAHLMEHLPNQMKASNIRKWLIAAIGDYFSDIDETSLNHPYNMSGVVFDDNCFARIIKIVELDEDNPPQQPRIIRQAIRQGPEATDDSQPLQPLLVGFDSGLEHPKPKIKLGEMIHAVIGYIVGHNGLLVAFTFAEYLEDGNRLQNIYTLDLNSGSQAAGGILLPHSPSFDPSNPSTTIKLKPSHIPLSKDEEQA